MLYWNHSILDKNYFVPEWKASTDALDLAFELGFSEFDIAETVVFKPPKTTTPKVSFVSTVELYVGSECDHDFTIWPHALGVPHLDAHSFQPHSEFDHDQMLLMRSMSRTLPQFPIVILKHFFWISQKLHSKVMTQSKNHYKLMLRAVQRTLGPLSVQFEVTGRQP